jgi:hypothetical protein
MTVGKIYCAKLMVENYRQNKRRKQFDILDDDEFRRQVQFFGTYLKNLLKKLFNHAGHTQHICKNTMG